MLILTVFCNVILAQKNDSATTHSNRGLFRPWQAVGVNISFSTMQSNGKDNWLPFFYQIATTPNASVKYDFDIRETNKHTHVSITEQYNSLTSLPISVTFKPKRREYKTWLDYTEINVGLRFTEQSTLMTLWGYSYPTDSTGSYSYAKYSFTSTAISPDLLYTIQTPGIGGAVAIYGGVGVYTGFNVNTDIYSTASLQGGINYGQNSNRKDTAIEIFPQQTDFAKTTMAVGFYFPIGLKINLSPRSNISFEYLTNQHIQFFNNGAQKNNLYSGFSLGYRFKFGAAKKIAENKATPNAPAKPPEPFY